ncbi:hypothetical protein D3C80_1363600 [compost metagenome]
MGLLGGEHRVLVGQVHAAHIPSSQLATDHLGFVAVAHEDGDIRWQARAQFAFAVTETRRALLATVEQGDDMAGAAGRQLLTVQGARDRFFALQLPALQGCTHLAIHQQLFTTAFGTHLDERQRVVIGFTEQERPSPLASRLGLEEHLVDRRDHRLARAVVGVQAV